jgi:phosphate/sulfate permease
MASRLGWPVSTTHSIIGAVIGVGIAAFGIDTPDWSMDGVGGVVASWFISPVFSYVYQSNHTSGIIAVCFFLFTKYAVLRRKESLKWGLLISPLYFMIAFSLGVLYLLLKGGKKITIDGSNMTPLLLGAFGMKRDFNTIRIWSYCSYRRLHLCYPMAQTKTEWRKHAVVSHLLYPLCL